MTRTEHYPLIVKAGPVEVRDSSADGACEVHELDAPKVVNHIREHISVPGGVNACVACLKRARDELQGRRGEPEG